MKLVFTAGALTLMTIAGFSAAPANAQIWRGGYSHAGYGHSAPYLRSRGYGYGVGHYRAGYGRGYLRGGYGGGYAYAARHYGGVYGPEYSDNRYSHGSDYTAGFNRGAEAQWLVNVHHYWAYDYARWRQLNGPTGIFAGFGGYGYGKGYGFGRGYGV